MTAQKPQPNRQTKTFRQFVMVMARSGPAPLVLTILLVSAWLVSVLCQALFKLFTSDVEQSVATLLIGLLSTFVVLLYIALFLLIPGSIYIWAVRRAGKALDDDQWSTPLPARAKALLAILCTGVLLVAYVLFGRFFEVGDYDSYTSFFSMPVQIFYEVRVVFPFVGAALIAVPFWVFLYRLLKRRNCADRPRSESGS